tara:strand:+ start:1289 stop:1849 length:561 start_codon:yes stop_codon:yes gene_type:complete
MRIISGNLKGKSINFKKNTTTRPLKDSVKENIFNILKHSNLIDIEIKNSNVLDLYSGFGSFGIECISRGANEVIFIDRDINVINILKENLIKLAIIDKCKIFNNTINSNQILRIKKKFNIFFLDPPFANFDYIQNLEVIKKNNIFEKRNVVIIHREKNTNEDYESFINILEIKNYGRSKIIFGRFN